jgi:multiple sugar transport system substrate-binding protein
MMRLRFLNKRRCVRFLALMTLGLASTGCGSSPPPPAPSKPFVGLKLVVGVVGDPSLLPSIKAQRGEWSARTGAELVVLDEAVDVQSLARSGADVLVFPGDRMGDLVDLKALATIADSAVIPPEPTAEGNEAPPPPPPDDLKFKDIIPSYRDQVIKYGPNRVALPIGGSALVVAFHRNAFENQAGKEAAKAAGLTLEPPKTWEQFDALARFFHGKDNDGDGKLEAGVAIAWGVDPEGVGDSTLLARIAALGLHRDQFTFLLDSETTEPRVTSPPFVEGLKTFVALKAFGPPGAEKFDADLARKAFRSKEAVFLIDRAERAGTWGVEGEPIGTIPLPGSPRVFDFARNAWEPLKTPNRPSYLPTGGGWLVGVAASTPKIAAAEDFVKYLASPDSTNRLRAEKGFPMLAVRTSQLTQGMVNARSAPGVEPRPWADAVSRTLNAERVVPGSRFPGATAYLADLSKARLAAINGQDAEKALEDLDRSWTERTKALGLARQTWHHRRSLTGLITTPEPPPR